MFRCESRTRSENSNFPLKQVDNPCWRYTPEHHLAAALPSTSIPTVSNPKPEIHPPPSRKHEFAIRSPDSPRQSLLKIQIFPPQISTPTILRLHSQSINGRHLAVALATTFTLNFCHFSKFPPKSMYHCPPSSDNVKNPKPMSKTRNRKYTYRPPLSTDSNHLPSVSNLARNQTLGR